MKFLRKVKPSKIVGGKHMVHRIQGAMVRSEMVEKVKPGGQGKHLVEHLILYATNSFGFLRIDLGAKENGDEPGPVPAVALRHMEKGVISELGESEIRVGITHYQRVMGDFPHDADPRHEDDFPEMSKVTPPEPRGEDAMTLNINPTLLKDIADAMGESQNVQLTFDLTKRKPLVGRKRKWYGGAIRVKAPMKQWQNESEAVMMPIRPPGADFDERQP